MAVSVVRPGARPLVALLGGVLVLALAGCTSSAPADPGGGPTSTPPSSSTPTPPPTTDPKADMRTRLADALRATSPVSAGTVADPTTKLVVLSTPWLPGWQVVDVTRTRPPHPVRFAVGLSSTGAAQFLAGEPQSFDAMVQSARIRVGSGATAVSVAELFLDTTRTFEHYAYRVDDVSAIEWRSDLAAEEQASRQQVEQRYGHEIAAPRATPAHAGWTLTAWMVDGDTLVRHDLGVAADGAVTDHAEVVARQLPVPYSV